MGIIIGILIGALLIVFVMCSLIIGGDSEEEEMFRIIGMLDREVNREYIIIKEAIKYVEDENIDITTIRFNDIQDVKKDLLDILKGVDKE